MDSFDYSTVGPFLPCPEWPEDHVHDPEPQFPVSLYPRVFHHKPNKGDEFGNICKNIALHPTMVSIRELAHHVTYPYGYSWCAGIYDVTLTDGSKTSESWVCQHLFAIDVDHDPGDTDIFTWTMFLDRCREFGVEPCIVYSTFGAVAEERYRVVFAMTTRVEDEAIRDIINKFLLLFFPEADQSTTDAARIATGGRKLLYLNEDARLDLMALVGGCHEMWHANDKKNYTRTLNRFAEELGLGVTGKKLLNVRFDHPADREMSPVDNRVRTDGAAVEGEAGVRILRWDYNTSLLSHHKILTGSTVVFRLRSLERSKDDAPHTHLPPSPEDWRVLNNPNFKRLKSRCPVIADLLDDSRRFNRPERYTILKNLAMLKGGIALFEKAVENSKFDYDMYRIEAQIARVRREPLRPVSYRCYFPDVSTGYPSIWHAAQPDYGNVVVVEPQVRRPYAEAYREFEAKYEEVMASTLSGVFVLKAMPGFSKTGLAMQIRSGVTIASPRHNLIKEHEERMEKNGVYPVVQPRLPVEYLPFGVRNEIEETLARGCFRQVRDRLRAMGVAGLHPRITEYIQRTDDLKDVSVNDVLLATHVNVINAGTVHRTVIFDEDFLDNLLPIRDVRLKDVETLRDELRTAQARVAKITPDREGDLWRTIANIVEWCDRVIESAAASDVMEVGPVALLSNGVRHRLERVIAKSTLKSNIFHAMRSQFMLVVEAKGVRYLRALVVNDLPKDKKIIVLSATADEWLYRKLFGVQLKEFYDVGPVETTGSVIQYHDTNTSRAGIGRRPGWRSHLDDLHSGVDRITFKDCKVALGGHPDLHLGATTGLNSLAGKDIVVVGTPHQNISKYRLWAMALGHRPTDLTMHTQPVERNGMRFWFYTYKDEYLRNIHLHLVESELVQAAGRARHLHNPVIVTVYSNFPLPGAEHRKVGPEVLARLKGAKLEEANMSLAA